MVHDNPIDFIHIGKLSGMEGKPHTVLKNHQNAPGAGLSNPEVRRSQSHPLLAPEVHPTAPLADDKRVARFVDAAGDDAPSGHEDFPAVQPGGEMVLDRSEAGRPGPFRLLAPERQQTRLHHVDPLHGNGVADGCGGGEVGHSLTLAERTRSSIRLVPAPVTAVAPGALAVKVLEVLADAV